MIPKHNDTGSQRILNALAQDLLERTALIRVDSLLPPVYGFDPDGWEIYLVFRHECKVCGGEYWAYHPELDQVRQLDVPEE